MACEMLTPGFGGYALGLAIVGPPQNRYFTHGGPLRVNNRRLHCSIFEGGVAVTRLTYMAIYSIGALRSA
jgi:hypothetical protein